MSEVGKQRNLAMAVAAVCAIGFAGVVGYVAGRGGDPAPSPPQVGAGAPTPVAAQASMPAESATDRVPAGSARATPPEGRSDTASRPSQPASRPRAARTASPGMDRATESSAPEAGPVAGVEPAAGEPAQAEIASVPPKPVEIPSGTKIELVLEASVSSQTASVGDAVVASLTSPIRVGGEIAVPSGTRIVGRVSDVKALAKVGGQARLAIDFERLEVAPEPANIAAFWAREGKSETGKDAATIAAGAAIGTVLGNQAKKNDRGKVIGAIVGAGVGTAVAASTPGEAIELPAGARLEVTLRQATVLTPPG